MSIALDLFWRMDELTIPEAVLLSVQIGVGGWLWPISTSVVRMGHADLPLRKSPPNSDSAAEATTCLSAWHSTKMGPL